MASTQSQPNGVPSSSSQGPSQPTQNTSAGSTTVPNTQTSNTTATAAGSSVAANNSSNNASSATVGGPSSPTASAATTHAPRPRDARTMELLLTSQGVTSFDSRVPLLLLDFAYRHTQAILSDAIHLSTDPYTTHAGGKPSASSGAAPSAPSASDAAVTTSAVNLAIASRQAFQFRGGGAAGTGGGGASKDWLMELAKERNKVALPRVPNNDWGVRLPNERFVLSGTGWRLKENGAFMVDGENDDEEESSSEEESDDDGMGGGNGDAMEGLEKSGGDGDGDNKEQGKGLQDYMDEDGDEDMEDMI